MKFLIIALLLAVAYSTCLTYGGKYRRACTNDKVGDVIVFNDSGDVCGGHVNSDKTTRCNPSDNYCEWDHNGIWRPVERIPGTGGKKISSDDCYEGRRRV